MFADMATKFEGFKGLRGVALDGGGAKKLVEGVVAAAFSISTVEAVLTVHILGLGEIAFVASVPTSQRVTF